MPHEIVLRGGLQIIPTPGSGTGDPQLTLDTTTKVVGEVPAVDTSTFISKTLTTANIIVGNNSNVATAVPVTGVISLSSGGVTTLQAGVVFDSNINTSAAITYSKLNLTGGIVNTDINSSAAITRTKLANGTVYRLIVNNSSGVISELTALTANKVLVSDANGQPTTVTTTTTEVNYVAGVTSAIQTQLGNRLSFSSAITPVNGDIIIYSGGVWTRLAIGSAGQVLSVSGGLPVWGSAIANGIPTGGTANQYLNKIDGTNYNTQWSTLTLSKVTDVISTAAEVNKLSGVTTTAAQFNYLNTASSDIQAQINNRLLNVLANNAIFVGNSFNLPGQLAVGTNGQVLSVVAGVPQWATITGTGTVTSVAVSGGTTGLTTSGGPITTTGTITFAGTLIAVNGGTGFASYAVGDLLYANTTTTLAKLAAIATGSVLGSAGTSTAPAYLAVSNGLTATATTLKLGGALTAATTISGAFTLNLNNDTTAASNINTTFVSTGKITATLAGATYSGGYSFDNSAPTSLWSFNRAGAFSGTDFSISDSTSGYALIGMETTTTSTGYLTAFIVNGGSGGANFTSTNPTTAGITYQADYSTNYTTRSLTDKGYVLGTKTYTATQTFFTPTTGGSSFIAPHGAAPTGGALVDGAFWTTTAGLFGRINGATISYGAGTGTVTSVTGTTNRITITGTPTIAPVVDIAATYVGQTSITTLGTVTTGTWNAGVIPGQYGGTGIANTSKTITLGASLTTTGAGATTLAFGAGTNTYTFPNATMSVARTDAAQTFTGTQTFSPTTTVSGFNTGAFAGDPSAPVNGDITYNSTLNAFRARANGVWISLGSGGGTPGGANTQIQYNDSSSFNGHADFSIVKATGVVTMAQIPVFTLGIGSAIATTQAGGDNSTKVSTTAYVDALTLPAASAGVDGYLLGSDWTLFNSKITNVMTTIGDLVQGTTAGAPVRLAAVTTGNALISGGVATASSWGKIGLTTHISGILPLANGGTNVALSDPGAHSIIGWDDTGNVIRFFTIGTGLTYTQATNTLSASGGGGGITNSAANTELMKSDGVNAVPSGLFIPANGDINMGTGLSGASRSISATGTASNITLLLAEKGTGGVSIGAVSHNSVTFFGEIVLNYNQLSWQGSSDAAITGANNGPSAGYNITLTGGSGSTGNKNGGNTYLIGGTPSGSGAVGNIGLHTTTGSFGGGEKVLFINRATTNPSTNPTGGGILFVKTDDKPYWRDSAGVESSMTGGGSSINLGLVIATARAVYAF